MNCIEFLQHTLSNFDGELQLISTTLSSYFDSELW